MKRGISLIIHTKNEEKNIQECIESAKDIVDEIIVIDMYSDDRTVKLARKIGAKVYFFKDCGYVEPARNFGLSKSNFEWILTIDADERLTPILSKKLMKIYKDNKYDLVELPHKNIILGKWIRHSGWWPDYHYRFFRNGHLTNVSTIHAPVRVKGRVMTLEAEEENAIIHLSDKTISDVVDKIDRYSSKAVSFEGKQDVPAQVLLNFIENEFWLRYIMKEGYKDGMHGFVLSKFMEYYRFLEFVKFWEKNDFKRVIDPDLLSDILKERYWMIGPNSNDYYIFKTVTKRIISDYIKKHNTLLTISNKFKPFVKIFFNNKS